MKYFFLILICLCFTEGVFSQNTNLSNDTLSYDIDLQKYCLSMNNPSLDSIQKLEIEAYAHFATKQFKIYKKACFYVIVQCSQHFKKQILLLYYKLIVEQLKLNGIKKHKIKIAGLFQRLEPATFIKDCDKDIAVILFLEKGK